MDLGLILYLLAFGAVAGFVARLLVPGPDPMGLFATVLLGIAGSFVGGWLGYVVFDEDIGEGALQASGLVGSVVGAVLLLMLHRALFRRSPRLR